MNAGRPAIRVAVIGNVPQDLVTTLRSRLGEVFQSDTVEHIPSFRARIALDHSRKQYDSRLLLEALHAELQDGDARLIGITEVDLFVPVFTFVFGEAQLNGRVAVASLFRLRNSFYGLPEDSELLAERLLKEAVHEIGHTFGLVHCHNPRRVMHSSPAVEEVDLKRSDLCRSCRRAISLAE